MRTFAITEEYISTANYLIEAETEEEARQMVEEADVEVEITTDFGSGLITHISEVTPATTRTTR